MKSKISWLMVVIFFLTAGGAVSDNTGDDSSGFVFNAKNASIQSMLSSNVDRNVTVVLKSGNNLSGRIVDIKGELVYLSNERLKGRTNNHVLIRIDSIEALIFDAAEFK